MVSPGTMYRRISRTWGIVCVLALLAVAGCKTEVAKRKAAGNMLFNQGKYAEALVEYQAAVKAAPSDAPAHVLLGNAQLELGDYDAARASYQEALRLDPKAPEGHRGVMTVIAHTSEPGDRAAFDEFLGHADAIIEARPKDKNAIIMAGIVTSESANPADRELYAEAQAQAERYLRRALEIDDRDPKLLFHLALVYARKGEVDVALRVVDRLKLVEPQPGFHLYAGAIVHTIAGNDDDALAMIEQLVASGAVGADELAHPTGYLARLREHPRFTALLGN